MPILKMSIKHGVFSFFFNVCNIAAFLVSIGRLLTIILRNQQAIYNSGELGKSVRYVTAVASERRCHLANVIAIAKVFAN